MVLGVNVLAEQGGDDEVDDGSVRSGGAVCSDPQVINKLSLARNSKNTLRSERELCLATLVVTMVQ